MMSSQILGLEGRQQEKQAKNEEVVVSSATFQSPFLTVSQVSFSRGGATEAEGSGCSRVLDGHHKKSYGIHADCGPHVGSPEHRISK